MSRKKPTVIFNPLEKRDASELVDGARGVIGIEATVVFLVGSVTVSVATCTTITIDYLFGSVL